MTDSERRDLEFRIRSGYVTDLQKDCTPREKDYIASVMKDPSNPFFKELWLNNLA